MRAGAARRWALRLLAALGLSLCFVVSAGLGMVLHAELPVSRRLTARLTALALSDLIVGTVELEPPTEIGARRARVPKATLLDAQGRPVLVLTDIRIELPLLRLLADVLRGRQISLVMRHVRVERADVELLADEKTGEPTLVLALAPTEDAAPTPAPAGAETSDGTRVFLPEVEIGLVSARARFSGQPPLEAEVRGVQGQLLGSPKGLAVDVRRFGAVLRGFGADARGTGTLGVRVPGATRGTFEGFFGDIELRSSVFFEGSHVELSVDVPGASPQAMRLVLPDWPLRERASGRVVARGELPNLHLEGSLTAGPGTIEVAGPLVLRAPESADLEVSLRHVDARAVFEDAPPTDLSARGKVVARNTAGGITLDITADTEPTTLYGEPVPALSVSAKVRDGAVAGTVAANEPGMPLVAEVRISAGGVIDVDARTGALDLARISRFRLPGVSGRGQARLVGHVDEGQLRAQIDASVDGLSVRGIRSRKARIVVDAAGPIDAPEKLRGKATLDASHVLAFGTTLDHVAATARGGTESAQVELRLSRPDGATLRAAGTADLGEHPTLRDLTVVAHKDPVSIEGEIARLDPERAIVDVRRLRITGTGGELSGSLRVGEGLVELDAHGENVDLDVLARALGLPRGTLGGRMRIDGSLVAGRDVTRGRIRVGLGNVTALDVSGLSAQVSASLEGERFTGEASGLLAGLGTFGATWDGVLAGPVFEAASYRKATYRAEVQASDLLLPVLNVLLPKDGALESIDGRAYVHFLLEKRTGEAPLPNVFATAATRGLALGIRGGEGEPKTTLDEIDLNMTGSLDGTSGDATGTTLFVDQKGDLLTATGAIRFDAERLARDPLGVLADLPQTPIDAVLHLPSRPIQDLPEPFRLERIQGNVSATVNVRGSLERPTLHGSITGTHLAGKGNDGARPADVHVDGHYDWATHTMGARGTADVGGTRVATLTGKAVLPDGDVERWTGEARADLAGLPFDLLSGLAESRVSGALHGSAELTRSADGSELSADLAIRNAAVDRTPIGEGTVKVSTIASVVTARLGFRDESGHIDADGSIALNFDGVLPTLRPGSGARARVVAERFRAVGLSPLVSGVLSRLGGRVDADVTVTLTPPPPGAPAGETWRGSVRGTAKLDGGSALIDALGLEVRDIAFTVEARPQGKENLVTVKGLTGRVRSNRQNLRGSATLVLSGIRVVRGAVTLAADDMPILLSGAPQGRITGNVSARLLREPGRMRVDVDVPRLTMKLPQASARQVIDLGDNLDVTILQLAEDEADTGEALAWHLVMRLGDVSIERRDVLVGVTGQPTVDLGAEVMVGGTVDLTPGGRVPVLGKVFVVDRGRVTFDTGDDGNPRIDVTASYRARGDALIYADVTGTFRDAKLTLRSDPPLPEPEVFALLLGGGGSDPSSAESSGTTGGRAAGAVAIGGGVGALGLNELLSDSPVELRVDTTAESRPRYTAAVRVGQNLWFEASTYQQTSQAATGQGERSVFSGTVDYRFTRRWSLRTEVGTSGGALDLLWQYRY